MSANPKATFAAGVVVALLLGGGTAVAANGGNFVLGQQNKATKTSTLSNSKGTALSLTARSGSPALKVSNSVKIPKLNSDKLDGKDGGDYALTSGKTGYIDAEAIGIDDDQNGRYELLIAVAECPSGSKRTGGGAANFTLSGFTVIDVPTDGNAWLVGVITDNTTVEDPADVLASVVCYNPRGAVGGGAARVTASATSDIRSVPANLLEQLKVRALG